jgi:nitrate reductase delta subunit
MTDENRFLLKLLSFLLQYPDEELFRQLEELRDAAEEVHEPGAREICVSFLSYLAETSLIQLQEAYTATFDLNPATCLNLTYHKWGDARERGGALVAFHRLYHNGGYKCDSRELPDYLPMILEFLSVNRQQNCFSLLERYFDQVKAIHSRLQETGSPYAGLFDIVQDIFTELHARGV